MKIIIAGAGEVGSHLAKLLSNEFHNLTVIDPNKERLDKIAESSDVITVEGSSTSLQVLKQAGVSKCDLFIAVSPAQDQDLNIISSVLAKRLGASKVTARINNDEYLSNENKSIFMELGIDSLFYPEKIASLEISDLLKQTGTSEFMEFKDKLQLIVFRLEDGAPIVDRTIADIASPKNDLLYRAVAVSRDGNTIIPRLNTRFRVNDLVFVITKKENAKEAMAYSGKENIDIKRLMIIGGGRIAEMVAKRMEKWVDHISIIELKKERCEVLSKSFKNTNNPLIINGDGRNTDLLIEEDVSSFDAFVALTSSSETNILACAAAKKLGVKKTIAEIENIEYIKLAEGMGIDAVINKKQITASRIFRYTLSNKVESIKCLNGSNADILEFIVTPNSLITRDKIKNINFPKDAVIGGVIRGDSSFIAVGDSQIMPYDRVVVFSLPSALGKIDKFFL